jgi:hypothetical protein
VIDDSELSILARDIATEMINFGRRVPKGNKGILMGKEIDIFDLATGEVLKILKRVRGP